MYRLIELDLSGYGSQGKAARISYGANKRCITQLACYRHLRLRLHIYRDLNLNTCFLSCTSLLTVRSLSYRTVAWLLLSRERLTVVCFFYSRGPGFKSRPVGFHSSSQSFETKAGAYLVLGHGQFHLHPVHFTDLSTISRCSSSTVRKTYIQYRYRPRVAQRVPGS